MIEDDIAAAMAEHEHEAPTADDLSAGLRSVRRPRHGWIYAAAAALLVIGVVTGVWAAGAGKRTATRPVVTASPPVVVAPLSCPARYAGPTPWVPAKPRGIPGNPRLAPNETPKSVLMCAYKGSNAGDYSVSHWALAGKRYVTGNLAGLAHELAWQPRKIPGEEYACSAVGGTQTNYLIGLTYSRGTVWVSASDEPNNCVSGANGEFITLPTTMGIDATKAFASGRWPDRAPLGCRSIAGRLGQDVKMVPSGAVSLTICTDKAHTVNGDFGELVSTLNALPTDLGDGICSPSPRTDDEYQLIFGYRQGPPVSIRVYKGCYPEVYNGTLKSQIAGSVIPAIRQLLARH